jgi:hypothetical protein
MDSNFFAPNLRVYAPLSIALQADGKILTERASFPSMATHAANSLGSMPTTHSI